jgi:HEPN domain-containing protein
MRRYLSEEITWKNVRDYYSAAKILDQHGTGNTTGPKMNCQGLAIELALKFYLWELNSQYPADHDLEELAFNCCANIAFTTKEADAIKTINLQYLKDGGFNYPSRYRPNVFRAYISESHESFKTIISRIINNTKNPQNLDLILES